jgi:hypothetical protein
LYFENATKADLEQNMSYSAFVSSLSLQRCLPFEFLRPSRAIRQHDDEAAPCNAFQADSIQFEEAKASQSDGGSPLKLSLYVSVKVSLVM